MPAQDFLLEMDEDQRVNGHGPFPIGNEEESSPLTPPNFKRGNSKTQRSMTKIRIQLGLFNMLERPRTLLDTAYHIAVFAVVLSSLVLSIIASASDPSNPSAMYLIILEIFIVVWFTVELIIRVWSAGCISRYQKCRGRLLFLRRPFCIMDCIIIVATIFTLVTFAMKGHRLNFSAQVLRGLRFFQILRMVRLDRKASSWRLLGSVVWAHRQELFTSVYIGFLFLIFLSFLMFLAERGSGNEQFETYGDALWWGVITLCTVGYGDTVPKTWIGKLIASLCSIVGISFFALPAGILGSGFALKVQQQHRQKHQKRRRPPAAHLIQLAWRIFAVEVYDSSNTWKIHMKPPRNPFRRGKKEGSIISRLSRCSKKSTKSSMSYHRPANGNDTDKKKEYDSESVPAGCFHAVSRQNSNKSSRSSEQGEAIRSLISKTWKLTMENPTLMGYSGLQDLLRAHHELRAQQDSSSSEKNYDQISSTDYDESPTFFGENGIMVLTPVQKTAIRAILKMKFLVAHKKFREALRPYDVKDIIEQYSSGHADMIARIKSVHFRLDGVVGAQAPGYSFKRHVPQPMTISSRVQKVERKVTSIEYKLDSLIKAYEENRNCQQELLNCVTTRRPMPGRIQPRPLSNTSGQQSCTSSAAAANSSPYSRRILAHHRAYANMTEHSLSPTTRHRCSRKFRRRCSSTSSVATHNLEVPTPPPTRNKFRRYHPDY